MDSREWTMEDGHRRMDKDWTTQNGQWRTGIGEWTTDNPERMDNGIWNGQLRIDIKMEEIDCKNMWKNVEENEDRTRPFLETYKTVI